MKMDATTTSCWMWALACLLVGGVLGESNTVDYCKVCEDHIACKSSGGFAKDCPPDVKLLEMSANDKQLFINMHNKIRNKWAQSQGFIKVQACRMATLKWNDELAKLAELQVMKCTSNYDTCHNTEHFPNSGQNQFYIGHWPGKPKVLEIFFQALETWDNMGFWASRQQVLKYKSNPRKTSFDLFALMVVEENVAIGCAAIIFKEDVLTSYRVTCNYASNNFNNRPVFTVCRESGSKCETGRSLDYPGLCSENEVYDLKNYPRKGPF